jgi:beta-N-acetylhexosaminidase
MMRADVARLMWIVLEGPAIDAEADALLRRGVGGVILFSRNITGIEQLRDLTAELRRRAPGPLRIAIDHEGGHVARIGAPLTRFPSAMAMAAAGSEELVEACARAAARELTWLGIDVNLAPVLDVAVDPRNPSVGVRAFGSDPAVVGRFGAAAVRGYRAGGVAATAKHFPGHGRSAVDPHHALPIVPGGLDELRRIDLPPFRAAIHAGVELVMASHAAYDGLTDGLPSTVSPRILSGLLRGELGFDGLILTDALAMRALADDVGIAEGAVGAIVAGADVAMPIDQQAATLAALESAVEHGRIAPERLADALRRVAWLDARLAIHAPDLDRLPSAAHAELALDVARRSLTLRSSGDRLPLAAGTAVAVIDFASRRPSPIEEAEPSSGPASLAAALVRAGLRAAEVRPTGTPTAAVADRRAALEAAARAEVVVCATRDAYLWEADGELVAELAAADRPVVTVALRNPYDLEVLARTDEAIAAYADVPATFAALADALTGRSSFVGRLPATLMAPGAVG